MKHLLITTTLMFPLSGLADTSTKVNNYYKNLESMAECAVTMNISFELNGGYNIQRRHFHYWKDGARRALGNYLVKNGTEAEKALTTINEFHSNIIKRSESEWDNGDKVERMQLVDRCVRYHSRLQTFNRDAQ